MIELQHPDLSLSRQCELLGLNRATYYYQPVSESAFNLEVMRRIDEQYLKTPFYGWPRMTAWLRQEGYALNHKRVQRLMKLMGLLAVYPKPRTSQPAQNHLTYPYLLTNLVINQPNQVWCSDITYIPLSGGFMYLVVIMDWFSRFVLAWQLSNTLDSFFCQLALEQALLIGTPKIFNTDQGTQFTAQAFTAILLTAGIQISMDGRGRFWDNIFIERLWRSLKYEEVYLRVYPDGLTLQAELENYLTFYNHQRLHQSLDYHTPADVYFGRYVSQFADFKTTLSNSGIKRV